MRITTKGCSVGRNVGDVRGMMAMGRKWWRRRNGSVGGDNVREASFPTNLARVGLCGP
jgi:hypothetical protein